MIIDMPLHEKLQVNSRESSFKSELLKAKVRAIYFREHLEIIPEEEREEVKEIIDRLEGLIADAPEILRLLEVERAMAWN